MSSAFAEEEKPLVADDHDAAGKGPINSTAGQELTLTETYGSTGCSDQSTNGTSGRGQSGGDANQLSFSGVYIHALKGVVGLGILSLPYGFSFSGLLCGIILMSLITMICTHCMHMLANNCDLLSKRFGQVCPSFGKVAELSFLSLPGRLPSYKTHFRYFVNCCIFLMQIGILSGSQLFVGKNIHQVLAACGVEIGHELILVVFLPFYLLGSLIRELKTLVVFSAAAIILQLISFVLIIQFLARHLHWDEVRQIPPNFVDLGIVFGLFIFPLENTCLILPLKNRSQKIAHFNTAVSLAMLSTLFLYILIGALGYISFPNHPHGSITLSLPSTGQAKNIPNIIVKLYYPGALIIHYFLQLYPITNSLDEHFSSKYKRYGRLRWMSNVMRLIVVIFTFTIAVSVPNIKDIVSISGAVAGASVSLIIPAVIDMCANWSVPIPRWVLAKDILIAIAGLLGMAFGLVASIRNF